MADKKINNVDVNLLLQQNIYLHQILLSILNTSVYQSSTSSGSRGTDVDSKQHSSILMFKRPPMTTDPLEQNEDSNQPEEEATVVDQDTLKEMCADDSLQLSDISNFFLRDSNGRETKITDLHHLDLSKIERRENPGDYDEENICQLLDGRFQGGTDIVFPSPYSTPTHTPASLEFGSEGFCNFLTPESDDVSSVTRTKTNEDAKTILSDSSLLDPFRHLTLSSNSIDSSSFAPSRILLPEDKARNDPRIDEPIQDLALVSPIKISLDLDSHVSVVGEAEEQPVRRRSTRVRVQAKIGAETVVSLSSRGKSEWVYLCWKCDRRKSTKDTICCE